MAHWEVEQKTWDVAMRQRIIPVQTTCQEEVQPFVSPSLQARDPQATI